MKNFLLLLSFLIAAATLPAQNPVKHFYQDHKRLEGVKNYQVPGWLIWLGTGIARPFVNEPDARAALKLAKRVKKLRLLIAEDENPLPAGAVEDFVATSRQQQFEDLIYVRDGDTHVNILVRDKKEKIREMIILIDEPGSLVFLGLKTKIRYQDISRLIEDILWTEEKKPDTPEIPSPVKEEEPAAPRA